jgi:hypothetical protein
LKELGQAESERVMEKPVNTWRMRPAYLSDSPCMWGLIGIFGVCPLAEVDVPIGVPNSECPECRIVAGRR